MNLIQKFQKTKLADEKTKELIGKLIYDKFHNKDTSMSECEELLSLAWQFQITQFNDMLIDFETEFYKIDINV